MVVMAEYSIQDRLSELWHHIHQLHFSYLETEDSPQKIDQRNKLEAFIKEYLCLVPNQQKYYFRETADVLHRSASSKTEFSGYRAAVAWNAISMYAGNLLAQPWRKEYREIKLYCGFYKHEIETNLVGAEIMLEAMGYKHCGDSVMVLDGPICPDRVANVSRDSLIAFVECQIIKSIWEEVSPRFNISWLEVLEYRERHVCSPEQAVRALTYRWHERTYQSQHGHSVQHPVYAAPAIAQPYESYGRYNLPPTQQQCVYGTNPYYGYATYGPVSPQHCGPPQRYGTVPYALPLSYQPTSPKPVCSNGYCCIPPQMQNGYILPQTFPRTVPTAQLIELDSYGSPDTIPRSPRHISNLNNDMPVVSSKARDDGTGTFDSWDYVFRNLESQGYNKDMGQRGDLLTSATLDGKKQIRKAKPVKLNESMQKLRLDEDSSRCIEEENLIQKALGSPVVHNDSYDNVPNDGFGKQKPNCNGFIKTKTSVKETRSFDEKVPQSATLDVKKLRKVSSSKPIQQRSNTLHKDVPVRSKEKNSRDEVDAQNNGSKWHCNACTFLNPASTEICDMCGKSKGSTLQPVPPSAVGGSECPKCTLINDKDIKICEACGASLTNSPTYI